MGLFDLEVTTMSDTEKQELLAVVGLANDSVKTIVDGVLRKSIKPQALGVFVRVDSLARISTYEGIGIDRAGKPKPFSISSADLKFFDETGKLVTFEKMPGAEVKITNLAQLVLGKAYEVHRYYTGKHTLDAKGATINEVAYKIIC
jgi:hypothetical protein